MVEWLISRRRLVWAMVAVSVAAAALAVWRLPVDTNVLSILSPDDPVVRTYRETEQALPSTNTFLVVAPVSEEAALRRAAADLVRDDAVASAVLAPPRGDEALLVGRFAREVLDLDQIRASVRAVRGVLDRHLARYGLTGIKVVLLEGVDWVQTDLLRAGIIAAAMLAVFFAVFYRDGLLALLAVVPVLTGLAWALAAWRLAGGRLTIMAATVPTLVLGLGVDYTIHLASAVRESLVDGLSRREAVIAGARRVAYPMAIGAVTTASAFGALLAARMPGLVDMGYVGLLSVLGIFAATFLTVPALLVALPNRWLRRKSGDSIGDRVSPPVRSVKTSSGRAAGGPGKNPAGQVRPGHTPDGTPGMLSPDFLDRLMPRLAAFVPRRRRAIAACAVAVTAAAAALIPRLTLETDYTRFENINRPARRLQDRLLREADISPGLVVVLFRTVDESQAFGQGFLAQAGAYPTIRRVDFAQPLPLGVAHPLQLADGRAAAVIHPVENVYSSHAYAAFRADLERLLADTGLRPTGVTGGPVVNDHFAALYPRDMVTVLAVCAAVIVVLLVAGMRSVRLALFAVAPLVCGAVWAGGALVVSGQNLSLAGAIVAPLILGIGVDDGVHILIRWRQTRGDLAAVLSGTGRAVFATTVTTVCAFAAFILTRTPALVQVGWLISVGLTGCLIASILALPALGEILGHRFFHRNGAARKRSTA